MIRKLTVSFATSFIAAASLTAGALAQNAQQEAPPAPELVKEIQSRLFELNYTVWPDGNWDDRTKAAIRSWHQIANRPVSNVMSDDDMAYLRKATPYKVWGGVIYDSKGHYRLFTNEASRKELVDKEISYCRERFEARQCGLDLILQTTMGAPNCTGVSHADWTDAAGGHSTSSTTGRPTIKAASEDAINACAKIAPRESCKLLAAVCADGSSQTGELENKP
jgi:peptidoglycan hydrolase-like protein with peptidoglycan-binding domain